MATVLRRWYRDGVSSPGSASRPAVLALRLLHNGIQEWEKRHPRLLSPASAASYRRLTFMMLDASWPSARPGVEPGGPAAQVEGQNVAERDGLPTASATASALALLHATSTSTNTPPSIAGGSLLAADIIAGKRCRANVSARPSCYFVDLLRSRPQAGASKYPYELLKEAGVDLATAKPYRSLIAHMNRVMDEIEKIRARLDAAR